MINCFNPQPQNASWIELHRAAFEQNVSICKTLIGKNVLLGCVLKGNAYGHGFPEMLSLVYENPIDMIFVINPNDAFYIRDFEKKHTSHLHRGTIGEIKKRIVVMGALMPEEACECAKQDIEICLGDEHFAELGYFEFLEQYKSTHPNYNPLKVHIHVDTGLGREGICVQHLEQTLSFFKKNADCIFVQGIMSHFSNVEDVTEQTYAQVQLNAFNSAYDTIIKTLELKHKPEKHIAQSAATLIMPKEQYDIVRIGISLYGYWPSSETKISARLMQPKLHSLMPVLQWKVKSQSVKDIPAESYIGYGCSYRTDRAVKAAILPVGYFDGLPRHLSNLGHVLVNGKRCKILGRVMMNYCIVDVTEATHNNAPIEAILIGKSGDENLSVEMLADWSGTIQYEIVTRIGAHLKRVII